MPVVYTKTGGQGHQYQVPDYPEAADGPKAFKDFADFLDLVLPPVGTIMPYVGSTAPTGWLLCDGASYSSTSYPKLSALCGTKFGTAGAGLFKVPDLKGRSVVGLDSGQTEFDTIGKVGGAKSVTLTTSNMPAHDHAASNLSFSGSASGGAHDHTVSGTVGTDGAHTHSGTASPSVVQDASATGVAFATGTSTNVTRLRDFSQTKTNLVVSIPSGGTHTHSFSGSASSSAGHTHTVTGSVSGSVGSAGSGTAFSVVGPYITLNHIIRAA